MDFVDVGVGTCVAIRVGKTYLHLLVKWCLRLENKTICADVGFHETFKPKIAKSIICSQTLPMFCNGELQRQLEWLDLHICCQKLSYQHS